MSRWSVSAYHKISNPDGPTDFGIREIPDGAFSDKKTLGRALRAAGVLGRAQSMASMRVEGDKVIVFPGRNSIWHSITLKSVPDGRVSGRDNGPWVPAAGGTEPVFTARSGKRLQYMFQPSTGRHAYLDVDSDVILSDRDAEAHLRGRSGGAVVDRDRKKVLMAIYKAVNVSDKHLRGGLHTIMLVGGPAERYGVPNYSTLVLENLSNAELTRVAEAYRLFKSQHAGRSSGSDVDARNRATSEKEIADWLANPPAQAFVYYSNDMREVQNWMGVKMGDIVHRGPVTRRFSGKVQSIRVRGTNGANYHGICNLTGGTYCKLRKSKA